MRAAFYSTQLGTTFVVLVVLVVVSAPATSLYWIRIGITIYSALCTHSVISSRHCKSKLPILPLNFKTLCFAVSQWLSKGHYRWLYCCLSTSQSAPSPDTIIPTQTHSACQQHSSMQRRVKNCTRK